MQTVQQIVDAVQKLPEKSRIMILAPLVRDRKGEYQSVFEDLRKSGYARVRVDGEIHDLSEDIRPLDKYKKHSIEVVVDRLVVGQGDQTRIADSVETALKVGAGVVLVSVIGGEELLFGQLISLGFIKSDHSSCFLNKRKPHSGGIQFCRLDNSVIDNICLLFGHYQEDHLLFR